MNWINLEQDNQLVKIRELSFSRAQVIFKHSTRCATSSMALNRLERNQQPVETDFYFLDLIRFRSLSNQIASSFKVFHESPQVLLIRNGTCVYDESHNGIQMDNLIEQLQLN